ncbi:hypothetical protein ACFLTD_04970, partial [Elusimicrobiota bacterium]
TYWGNISYTVNKKGSEIEIELWGEIDVPGKILIRSPLNRPIKTVNIDNYKWTDFTETEIEIKRIPARIVIGY